MTRRCSTLLAASTLLFLPAAGCGAGWKLLDHEAFQRTLVRDKLASATVGSDAEPRYTALPGDRYYVPRGREGARQVHMFSPSRHRTTIIDGDMLRKETRIVVIAHYGGSPPPSDGWMESLAP